jgi:phage gp16-like protein
MSQVRQRELARIHCLAKELGLDDGTYRDVLWTCARVRSARDLDQHGRKVVIEHMQARQQRPAQREQTRFDRSRGEQRQPRPGSERASQTVKIQHQMQDLGVGDAYVDAIARRVVGVDRWRWATPQQLHKIVAALWYSQRRQKN